MRTKLPTRRSSITAEMTHQLSAGGTLHITVTYGHDFRRITEVFCNSAKEGHDWMGLLVDGSVMISHLLQNGYSITDVESLLTVKGSVFATIARFGAELERELTMQE